MSIDKELGSKYPEAMDWLKHKNLSISVGHDMEDKNFKFAIFSNKENESEESMLKLISELLSPCKSCVSD